MVIFVSTTVPTALQKLRGCLKLCSPPLPPRVAFFFNFWNDQEHFMQKVPFKMVWRCSLLLNWRWTFIFGKSHHETNKLYVVIKFDLFWKLPLPDIEILRPLRNILVTPYWLAALSWIKNCEAIAKVWKMVRLEIRLITNPWLNSFWSIIIMIIIGIVLVKPRLRFKWKITDKKNLFLCKKYLILFNPFVDNLEKLLPSIYC